MAREIKEGDEVRIISIHPKYPAMKEQLGRVGKVTRITNPAPFKDGCTHYINIEGCIRNWWWRLKDIEHAGKFPAGSLVRDKESGARLEVVACENGGMVRVQDDDGEFVRHEDTLEEVPNVTA